VKRAVFLDRDGVLVEDVDLLARAEDLRVLPGTSASLRRLKEAGFWLGVVTNQTVIARGLVTEAELARIHDRLRRMLRDEGAPPLDAIYVCPHHPQATLPEYRVNCACRKPRPGMLLQAAREHDLDLSHSFLVGDRLSDILAGARAGCRTAWVLSGMHSRKPIESPDPQETAEPDFTGPDLAAATEWILSQT
jgi:D-glycero-D-manno-heptose 1,7-bisphosphate phosphatase